ncbi:MAG: glutamate-5-semialdehyde dehydrogenase [Fibrobacterota bacterium]
MTSDISNRTKKVIEITDAALRAAKLTAYADASEKNRALLKMAALLDKNRARITKANKNDMELAAAKGLPDNLTGRLAFGESKIDSRIESLKAIAALPDPVGEIYDHRRTANGLDAARIRVPLGVIMMIYEARPHVTVNSGAFALKAGNAIICKGGSEAAGCNALLGELWRKALEKAGLPSEAVQIASLTHGEVDECLTMTEKIDLVIPRGGKKLIESVSLKSRIPVIKHFEGICHVYIGPNADPDKAVNIALDSKVLMPHVCNASETLLIDRSSESLVPELIRELEKAGVEIRGCKRTAELSGSKVKPASEEDWKTEYLDKTYSVRIVDNVSKAVEHINKYGSGHTDAIVTEDLAAARAFKAGVDSGVVLVNASTMFCDGATLGMGTEIGISTDKIHSRGPMGLKELTTYKFIIDGDGQIMTEKKWR